MIFPRLLPLRAFAARCRASRGQVRVAIKVMHWRSARCAFDDGVIDAQLVACLDRSPHRSREWLDYGCEPVQKESHED